MHEHGSSQHMPLFHFQSQETLEYIIYFTDGVKSHIVTTKVKYGIYSRWFILKEVFNQMPCKDKHLLNLSESLTNIFKILHSMMK